MENIAHLVWLYVKRRPVLKDALRENIVNFSALARKISIEAFGGRHENAVKMALFRLSKKMEKVESGLEEKILGILKKSSMVVKTKVAVIITTRQLDIKSLSYTQSGRHITYIVEQRDLEKLEKKPARTEENLNLITIQSPEELEEVPGVISFLLGALASEGINVVEFISCYTDTLLVIKQADTEAAYRILSGILE
jgi:aspartokinase